MRSFDWIFNFAKKKKLTIFSWFFEIWVVQRIANLVDLEKCWKWVFGCKIWLRYRRERASQSFGGDSIHYSSLSLLLNIWRISGSHARYKVIICAFSALNFASLSFSGPIQHVKSTFGGFEACRLAKAVDSHGDAVRPAPLFLELRLFLNQPSDGAWRSVTY